MNIKNIVLLGILCVTALHSMEDPNGEVSIRRRCIERIVDAAPLTDDVKQNMLDPSLCLNPNMTPIFYSSLSAVSSELAELYNTVLSRRTRYNDLVDILTRFPASNSLLLGQ